MTHPPRSSDAVHAANNPFSGGFQSVDTGINSHTTTTDHNNYNMYDEYHQKSNQDQNPCSHSFSTSFFFLKFYVQFHYFL